MKFQAILPSPPLHLIVERYWIAEAPYSPGQVVEVPVSAGIHHGFHFCCKVPHRLRYPDGMLSTIPKCCVAGHLTQRLVHLIADPSELFGVDLKPTALYKVLGLAPEKLTDAFMDIEVVFGQAGRRLKEQLEAANSFEKYIQVAESFLANYLSKNNMQKGHVEQAIAMIMHHEGNISMGAIGKALHISERHLLRTFTKEVGISPKLYARIIRFNRACSFLEKHPNIKVQDIVYEFGYFDQSHLIKDFVRFSGKNLAGYFKDFPDFNKDYFF